MAIPMTPKNPYVLAALVLLAISLFPKVLFGLGVLMAIVAVGSIAVLTIVLKHDSPILTFRAALELALATSLADIRGLLNRTR